MRILVLALVALGLQGKPDYNGTWLFNSTKSVGTFEKRLSVSPERMTLAVTDKDVTIGGQNVPTTVCAFGATPAENPPLDLCSAKWNGDALVITRSKKAQPGLPTSPTTVVTYVITGSELKAVAVASIPGRNEPLTTTMYWDRAK